MTTAHAAGNIPEIRLEHRLRIAREFAGFQQAELAEQMGVGRNTVSNAEAGKGNPRKVMINAWALATGVPVAWLLTGDTNAENPHPDDPDGGQTVRQQGLEPRTRWSGVTRLDQRRPPSIPPVKTSLPKRRVA